MEIKIPKEVRRHKETIFFGLSTSVPLRAAGRVCSGWRLLRVERYRWQGDGKLGLHSGRSATRSRRFLSVQQPDAGSVSMGRH